MSQPNEAGILRCLKATGANPIDAIILYRLMYWNDRSQIVRGDHRWVVRSHQDWADELGFSVHQIKLSVGRLRDSQLVITEKHLFANKPVNHFRLSGRARAILALDNQSKFTPVCSVSKHAEHIKELKQELKQDLVILSDDDVCAQEDSDMEKKPTQTVAEFLANKTLKPGPAKVTGSSLGFIWLQSMKLHSTEFQKPLTIEDQAKLKKLRASIPPGAFVRVIQGTLADWIGFVLEVKQQAGLSSVPEKPHIGFLLKHAGIAVNFTKTKSTKALVTSPATPTPEPMVPVKVKPAKKEKASLAEIMAILDEGPSDQGG